LLPRRTARQPQDGVGGGGQAGVVSDEDDGVAGREPADHREQALCAGLVQAVGRLVQDWTSADDSFGTTTYNIRFNGAGTEYKSVLQVLPDADAWGDDNEEMYHTVRFQVTSDNGVVSAWTPWENSPEVTFHL
jgi:hypothetical protein